MSSSYGASTLLGALTGVIGRMLAAAAPRRGERETELSDSWPASARSSRLGRSDARRVSCSGSRDLHRALALHPGDQLAHGLFIAVAQQRHRIGLAAHDPLEELLAILVRGECALGPAPNLVQQHGQPRVGLAELAFDLALHALR